MKLKRAIEYSIARFTILMSMEMNEDIRDLIPRNKFDLERAQAAIAAGYPAVAPILPELLSWIADMNWPIAEVIAPFLASIGEPLAPHIERVFETDDDVWKGWIIHYVIGESPQLAHIFRGHLERFAWFPTHSERDESVEEYAQNVLRKYGWDE